MTRLRVSPMTHFQQEFLIVNVGWQVTANHSRSTELINMLQSRLRVPIYLYNYNNGSSTTIGENNSIVNMLSNLHPTTIHWRILTLA